MYNYTLIIVLWMIAFGMIALSFFALNNFNKKDISNKDRKETYFFKIAISTIIIVASLDSSLSMKSNIDKKLLNASINDYLDEGFIIIDTKSNEERCQIPNSVIYLDNKGNITTEEKYSVKLCI